MTSPGAGGRDAPAEGQRDPQRRNVAAVGERGGALLGALDVRLVAGLASGLSTVQLASRLHLSRQGVEYRVSSLLRRLRAPNRVALVARAYDTGVLAAGAWPPTTGRFPARDGPQCSGGRPDEGLPRPGTRAYVHRVRGRPGQPLPAHGAPPDRGAPSGSTPTGRGGPGTCLSPVQRRILAELAAGRSARELAQRLSLSRKGVEYHIGTMLRKLAVPNRTALVAKAYALRVLLPGDGLPTSRAFDVPPTPSRGGVTTAPADAHGESMDFSILGPLRVQHGGADLSVSGTCQRAVLGSLLLRDNEAMATSALLKAIWGADPPRTARKMIQNAVSGLRNLLSADTGPDTPLLLTHPPGYLLHTAPDRIDRRCFDDLVGRGRAQLREGEPEAAARSLREALALWRGDPLADLVELGYDWPEATVLKESRKAAVEDLFEAQLACGLHHEVMGDLALAATAEPLRERLCGLIMLAAYRSGRQGEALAAYRALRTRLVAELGVEPGEELKALEYGILNQDPRLQLGSPPARLAAAAPMRERAPAPDREREAATPGADPAAPVVGPYPLSAVAATHTSGGPVPVGPRSRTAAAGETGTPAPSGPGTPGRMPAAEQQERGDGAAPTQPDAGGGRAERRDITVVMVTADAATEAVARFVEEEIERCGGVAAPGPGSSWCGYFGATRHLTDHAERALTAVGAITRWAAESCPDVSIRVAMHSGEAVVSHNGTAESVPLVEAGVLDSCRRLAAVTVPGHLRIDSAPGRPAPPRLTLASRPQPHRLAGPFVGRTAETDLLQGMLRRVAQAGTPGLATLVGAPGIGKTRLLAELAHRAADGSEDGAVVLRATAGPGERGTAASILGDVIRDHLGLHRADDPAAVEQRLADCAAALGTAHDNVLPGVRHALGLVPDASGHPDAVDACVTVLRRIARTRPTVLLLDDIHLADDELAAALAVLTGVPSPLPVLVVAAGRPGFGARLTPWHERFTNTMHLVLDPLPDTAVTRLLASLLSTGQRLEHFGTRLSPAGSGESAQWRSLLTDLGGNPGRAEEFAAAVNAGPDDAVVPVGPWAGAGRAVGATGARLGGSASSA
ncbi:BTAD domain-containing putative transcriptional regulator [Streptomyces bohaiensis]|uniref:BTAD domain-containing putative transcriptional regulator n=1 Tax=Streptomyces bohaiensis TaxID=1431344 RepID=UPI003B7C9E3E